MSKQLSRREALGLALGSAAFGCRSGKQSAPSPPPSATPNDEADLVVTSVTNMQSTERGGHAVVLLHGYGASGDDLLPLANALLRPGTRFLLPAAPLALTGGGRAWWALTPDRPRQVTDLAATSQPDPSPALAAVRSAVQRVLANAIMQFAPETMSLVGFSQGAMLSLDVALVAPPGGAERLRTELTARHFDVTWRPFTGGHEVPREIVRELSLFLFGS